jgi:hypothetical protein
MKPSPRRLSGFAAAMIPLAVLSACAEEPAQAPSLEAAPVEDVELIGALAGALDDGTEPMPVTLEAVNGSGVEGRWAAIQTDDSVQLNLMVQGLPRQGEYQAHVHRGSCDTGGAVIVPLNPVVVQTDGMGRSTTTIAADRFPADGSHFVQVHGASGVLACGDAHGR